MLSNMDTYRKLLSNGRSDATPVLNYVLVSLTLVFGLELPVAGSGPGGHGPGAEVRVLSGLGRQLQTHGGDVSLSDWNHIPAQTPRSRSHQLTHGLIGASL